MKIVIGFFRMALYDAAIFRLDFLLGLVSVFFLMATSYSIWTILYHQRPGAFGVDLQQMTTYAVLGMLLQSILGTSGGVRWYIASQVRAGMLDVDLLKPLDFMLHMLVRNIGEVGVELLTEGVPGLLFAFAVLHIRPPASMRTCGTFVVSLILGYLIYFGVNFLIGMLAIITHDIRSYNWAFGALIRFTSGELIPLWLFPSMLRTVASWLPFQAIFYVPISIYIGAYQGSLWRAIGLQLLWAAGLLLVSRWFWTKVQRRIVVQGG